MKKVKAPEDMRASYERVDFPALVRSKFYKEAAKGTTVALLEPAIAKAFPTSEAVNAALRGLLKLTEETARITKRPVATRTSRTATTAMP